VRVVVDAHMVGSHETGNETYILNLVRALALTGDVQCAAAVVAGRSAGADLGRVKTIALKPSNDWARLAFSLSSACRQWRAEILHVTYVGPAHAPCPLVVSVHDSSFKRFPAFFSRRDRLLFATLVPRALREAAAVITLSKFAQAEILDCFPYLYGRVHATPLAASPEFRPRDRSAAQARVGHWVRAGSRSVLAVGNLQPRKNLLRLIRAFGLVRAQVADVRLVIVGRPLWDVEPLYSQVQKLGLMDDVAFTGYVTSDELVDLYNAADVFAYPSLYEGFGLPVLEAMACGTPVVASNTSSIPEVAGDAALLVDPYNEDEIAQSLLAVLDDPALAARLSAAGLRRAGTFSWQQTAAQTAAIYQHVLSA